MELFLCFLKWGLVAGAAALALHLLRPVLDRRCRAQWRYWTWLVLACALLLGPGMERVLAASAVPAPPVVIQVPRADIRWQADREAGVRLQVLPSGAAREESDGAGTAPESTFTRTLPIGTLLPVLWLAGGELFLLRRLLGTFLFCRRARRWSRQPGEETRRIYEDACAALRVRRPPVLLVSEPVGSPMMTGLLRPRLYLPGENWDQRELAFILRHELTHFRRRDLWYKLLLLLANALHWFNPLIYLLSREAERDLELTCDDAVVDGCGQEDRRAYSETLLASLHRQRGLGRTVLSTHFYGGAEVMKDRFRNILTQNKRKFGVTALLLAVLLTGCAAVTLGFRQEAASELTAEELAEWEERLNSTELNGFVSHMYSDIRYLPLGGLFYNHMGDPLTDSERAVYRAAWGDDPPMLDISAVTRREADAFLLEYTGLALADFPGSLDAQWSYSREGDRWYFFHGDTNFTPVTVTGGVRQGDTIVLNLEGQFSSGLPAGELTVTDGKFTSFTTPLYTQVEALARERMDSAFAWLTEDAGIVFTDRCLTDLWCFASESVGEEDYTAWAMTYRLKPEDPSKVPLAGAMETVNGWLTQSDGPGDPVVIVSVKDGQVQLREWTDTSVMWEPA